MSDEAKITVTMSMQHYLRMKREAHEREHLLVKYRRELFPDAPKCATECTWPQCTCETPDGKY